MKEFHLAAIAILLCFLLYICVLGWDARRRGWLVGGFRLAFLVAALGEVFLMVLNLYWFLEG